MEISSMWAGKIGLTGNRVIDGKTRECRYDVKAHGGEIMDIAIHGGTIVSCARDRTAQVFVRDVDTGFWSLSQTLDDHTASVSRVLFLEDGKKLLSCSTDRTIVVRELCRRESIDGTITWAYIPIRTLSTKASPIHMTAFSDISTTLLVSTLDRQIMKFDMVTGKNLHSFKVTDESGDPVVMDAITLTEDRGTSSRPRIVVGTSTTDKSIRLYDLGGALIDKEWGHTEGVSDVALLQGEHRDDIKLISTGTDGTIMIWDFVTGRKDSSFDSPARDRESSELESPTLTPKETPIASRTPLRRVLSRSELGDFSSAVTPTPGTPSTPDPTRVSGSHSVGSMSPPRPLRKKTSAYSLHRQAFNAPKSNESSKSSDMLGPALALNRPESQKGRTRDRTPSPPDVEKRQGNSTRRLSQDSRVRGKSDAGTVSAHNVNTLAESLTRSLRTFRRKMDGASDNNAVRPEVLRDLQRELSLTIKDIGPSKKSDTGKRKKKEEREGGGRERSSSSSNEGDVMAALLEQYSSKLLSMVNDRLEEKYIKKEDSPDPTDFNSESFQDRERTKEKLETTGEG
jgi:WD40 repeat protein